MSETIEFKLNGAPVRVETDGERRLLWVLRSDLGLTWTKYACGQSLCGGPAMAKPPVAQWKDGVWRRDFANGIALVNPAKEPVTITLEPGCRRLRGQQDPGMNNGDTVNSLTLNPKDGIILQK